MIIVGIDPGQKGGIAIIHELGIEAHPMPMAGKEIDGRAIGAMLSSFREALVIVEKVHAMPKQGVSSTFKFGSNYGRILGVIEALNMSYELVTPQAWKKAVLSGTDKGKTAAVEFVHRRYPAIDLMPGRMRTHHDGMADAVCIAEYGRTL